MIRLYSGDPQIRLYLLDRYLSSQDNFWNNNALQLALLQICFCSKGYRAAIARSLSPPVAIYPGPKEPNLEQWDSLAENNFWYHLTKRMFA